MPSASRELRKKRRIKRNLSLYRRLAHKEMLDRAKVTTVLLSILAENGGEIEVSEASISSTAQSLGRVQYVVEKKNPDSDPFDGIYVVRLVTEAEKKPAAATAQAWPTPQEVVEGVEIPAATEPADDQPAAAAETGAADETSHS